VPAPSATGGRTARLGALDVLRFVAAMSVVAFHFSGITPAWDGGAPGEIASFSRWAVYGAMGVPLFFVISGFVVLMTAWGRDVPHFVASRVGRLFPAYWAAVLLAMLFTFAVWPAGSLQAGYVPTKGDALLNLTMLQRAIGVPDLDGSFWTLWTEARFYALIAVFILVGITRRRVLAFATLWPVAGALAEKAGSTLLAEVLISDYSPYFAGGMLLYVLYREGHDLGVWLLVGVQSLFALSFALGFYPGGLTRTTGLPASPTMVALTSVACFALVALVTLTRLNLRTARWMTILGALTYPLYLVHEKIGYYVIHLVRDSVSPWVALAAGATAALAVSAALHYGVEKPSGARLRAAMLATLQKAPTGSRPTATDDTTGLPRQRRQPPPPVHAAAGPVPDPRQGRGAPLPAPVGARD
jgi:peptidoglycan/LPS O-acetylase OafA/YrhL